MFTFAYLGMQQIVIILVIALLIFGPQKVPELGRQIGGALRDLKKMSNEVQSAFDLDDHHSYDRYEPPTYEYTPPVSTTYDNTYNQGTSYDHAPLDQYGLEEPKEPLALEGAVTVETGSESAEVPVLSPTIAEAVAMTEVPVPIETTSGAETTSVTETTAPETAAATTPEPAPTVTSADTESKGA